MGRRGPRPEPDEMKRARGTDRADRKAKDAPAANMRCPVCPSWLRSTARGCWQRVVPELEAKGILDSTDSSLLAIFCENWARWVKAAKVLQVKGETYEAISQNGTTRYYTRPEVKIEHDLAAMLKSLAAEFGMSSASRSRVSGTPAEVKKDDGKGKFFGVVG